MHIHESVRAALLPILPAALDIARRYGLPSDYQAGARPRHIAGNLAEPLKVRLVLLLAEPGSSPDREELNRSEAQWIEDVTGDGMGGGRCQLRYDNHATSTYERNPREFISMVWPGSNTEERMAKSIVTNSFWMQAHGSGGAIPKGATDAFAPHLRRLLSAFPNAVVIAAGNKAKDRCSRAKIQAIGMGALTPPGCNQRKIQDSWSTAARDVRLRLGTNEFAS